MNRVTKALQNFDFFVDSPEPLPRGIVSDTTITVNGYEFRKVVKEIRTKRKLKYEERYFCISDNVPNKVKANPFGTGYKSIGAFFTAWQYYKEYVNERKWEGS